MTSVGTDATEILRAEVLTIGDEVLRGEIVDSNKALMSERLHDVEIETRFQTSVLDHPEEMADAFKRAASRADVVLVSGGLGPTRDDLTTEVLAQTFGRELVLDDASLETIRTFFSQLGRDMSENNAKQAYFPAQAEVLLNPVGTAPGFMLDVDLGAEEGGECVFFAMPGVPRELKLMLDEQVLPRLLARAANKGGAQKPRAIWASRLSTQSSNRSQRKRALSSVFVRPFPTTTCVQWCVARVQPKRTPNSKPFAAKFATSSVP